jgi:hypothetical protein
MQFVKDCSDVNLLKMFYHYNLLNVLQLSHNNGNLLIVFLNNINK